MNKVIKNPFERRRKGTVSVLCILSTLFFIAASCGNSQMSDIENSDWVSCENKTILKILKDESAYIRKHYFEHVGRVDTFYFELVNTHSEFFAGGGIFPCGEIPEQFRKDGLSVKISGNVTSCITAGGCIEPNIKLSYIHFFELKSIQFSGKK